MKCAPLSFRDIANGALPEVLPWLELSASCVSDPSNLVESTERPAEPLTAAPLLDTPKMTPSNLGLEVDENPVQLEMVICSFALHLIESPSELFSVLWELSNKSRWLVILAPHKKPEVKDSWGWTRWDIDSWQQSHSVHSWEMVNDRVHCRVYRSTNIV
ncbi:hypothetical protein HGRIS_005838 [Hohenbuehelia grisea]|uniref:Uncharacterized protein n=1 Tax=Hohenbuehelia grisea TaxID=104357 RepID=A0ABR3JYX9_9AGAR